MSKFGPSKHAENMRTLIQKRGNSPDLRTPMPFAAEAGSHEDSAVDEAVRSGKLVVVAIEEPQLSIEDLVAKITPSNRHSEVETGKALGNEVW